ncbi:MAG: type II toxin-antitoxin system VapC family toxin, partial [Bradymonadaceae bacterium]
MLVCVDTSVLILTQQTEPNEDQDRLWDAARAYEQWMRESDTGVLLPTPVISEFLTGDPGDTRDIVSRFQSFGEVADFDLRAAELTGELRHSYSEDHELGSGLERDALTVDMMISAIAIVNRASYIVTHDTSDFREITDGYETDICGLTDPPPGQQKL